MKRTFKLFGLTVVAMALTVACGNANNTPAEEEIVAEEATEVVEEVVTPAQTPAVKAEEEKVCDEKEAKIEEAKAKLEKKLEVKAGEVAGEAKENLVNKAAEDKAKVEEAKAKFERKLDASNSKGEIKAAN